MDFREIDRILQAEFATKKVAAENIAAENLKRFMLTQSLINLMQLNAVLFLRFQSAKAELKAIKI